MNYFVLFSSPFCLINRLSFEPRQYFSLVQHKPCCTTNEDSQRLELSDLESKGIAKTDALISYALTARKKSKWGDARLYRETNVDTSYMRIPNETSVFQLHIRVIG